MADLTQMQMTAGEFLQLPESNQLIQLIGGEVIMSPSPTKLHQLLVLAIAMYLKNSAPDGEVLIAPLDVYIDGANVVQPDVFWVSKQNDRCVLVEGKYWQGPPDLVVEVLSPATAKLDIGDKFELYEKSGVREYWLVDQALFVQVYRLEEDKFARHGVFGLDQSFTSSLLGDQKIDVKKLLDQ